MEEQEETLVLNYIEDEFVMPTEPMECSEINITSFTESVQNHIKDIKQETENSKNLVVILEKIDLTPNSLKRYFGCKRRPDTYSELSITNSTRHGKYGLNKAHVKRISQNSFKPAAFLSRDQINSLERNLDLYSKTKRIEDSPNYMVNIIHNTPFIKTEKLDTLTTENSNEGNQNSNSSCVDVDLKYETTQQIHTEFKYESLSDAEENMKKKKGLNSIYKKKNSLKTSKLGSSIKQQTAYLDAFFIPLKKLSNEKKTSTFPVFKCDQCLYLAHSKAFLERHVLIHKGPEDITWYRCSQCDYKTKYSYTLKSHSIIHRSSDEIQYFQCPHCDQKCSRKHNLTNHIRSVHGNKVNNLRCADCDYATFCKDRLIAHVKTHSNQVYTCPLCKFMTKRKEYLKHHKLLKHTEIEKPFLCDTCSYKGKTKRELDRHYNRMHNKDKLQVYRCSHCSFTSIYKKNFEFHLLHMHRNSEGFQKFICGHCQKEFAYKNGLKIHIVRMHLKLTDDDWQKCEECPYKCKEINTLKRHITRNHGVPRLHCEKCSFGTNRQMSMIAHVKTHEVETGQILTCPLCPYRIMKATSFKYHMKTIHGKPITSKDIPKYYLENE